MIPFAQLPVVLDNLWGQVFWCFGFFSHTNLLSKRLLFHPQIKFDLGKTKDFWTFDIVNQTQERLSHIKYVYN